MENVAREMNESGCSFQSRNDSAESKWRGEASRCGSWACRPSSNQLEILVAFSASDYASRWIRTQRESLSLTTQKMLVIVFQLVPRALVLIIRGIISRGNNMREAFVRKALIDIQSVCKCQIYTISSWMKNLGEYYVDSSWKLFQLA